MFHLYDKKLTARGRKKPYRKFLQHFENQPELVSQMEKDFSGAENIENKVWLTGQFIYIRGYMFCAGRRSTLKDLDCRQVSVRYGTSYYLSSKCESMPFTIELPKAQRDYLYGLLKH